MKKAIAITLTALALSACDRDDRSPMRRDDTAPEGERQPRGGTPTPTVEEQRGARKLSPIDQSFANEAVSGGLFEVESSKAARERGELGPMKHIATMMITDHEKANAELQTLAKKNGWELPERMADKHQRKLAEIKEVEPKDLAKTYHRLQLEEHEAAVRLFESCVKNCENPDLKTFASRNLPTIRMHLEHVKKTSPTAALAPIGKQVEL
ncbi:MAG TPA: DUF4142 domain-containing protein [Polyangiaceae bacterium]|nr:DUF4142 domain-containing protein [Polyangiaceae bacterium]